MYLNKMSNVLQIHPHVCTCPKTEIFNKAHPTKLDIFGTCPKHKICANIKTTLLICTQLYEIMHKFLLIFYSNYWNYSYMHHD
jgi:hypothetical protein